MSIKVSVIVCTYNGESRLKACLNNFASLDFDRNKTELIIVNNNSNDKTRSISLDFFKQHPSLSLRYLFEPKQGLSHARNLGVSKSKGKYIFFLDDDVFPKSNWIQKTLRLYEKMPKAGCIGGKVTLNLPDKLPCWYSPDLSPTLSKFELKTKKIIQCKKVEQFPIGSNFSFLKKALLDIGCFNIKIGAGSKLLNSGEDTEACFKLKKAGYEIYYCPEITVEHKIDPKKISKKYFVSRAKSLGIKRVYYESDFKHFKCNHHQLKRYILKIKDLIIERASYPNYEPKKFSLALKIKSYLVSIKTCLKNIAGLSKLNI